MESIAFDDVKFEKENAIARFNRFRRIAKYWQILEVVVILGLISWSTARVPEALRISGVYAVEFSSYLLNHHVVFLIGNVIIVLLFMLCRQNDAVIVSGGDFYYDYVKHSQPANQAEEPNLPLEPETAVHEKQIVVVSEEKVNSQCDDVAAAIDKATRKLKRFQRTQSERLKREIAVSPRPELHRSETQKFGRVVSVVEQPREAKEIETLSNEDFQRTVDAFIEKNWGKRKTATTNYH